MAQVKQSKKQLSFGMLVGIFFGGFALLIIIGLIVGSALKGSSQQTTQIAPQPQAQQQVYPYQGEEQSGDIGNYMENREQLRNMQAITQQLNVMQSQMTGMQNEFNAGNANLGVQLQKMQNDMILLDRRISAMEEALKANATNYPMNGKKKTDWRKERQATGKAINDKHVVAATNGRAWITEQNTSIEVGDQIRGRTVTTIDDVRTKVYVN
ncbi:DNA-binding protein YbaB [Neisseria sp. HSC-16F19]|nr:hypothetical protein [Neisseria sp. HSC-16F19]MCP2041163.1 DNA-binding protein YbaB [Neisseria sp. HSC-16F19]